jgi:hypothetical protein
MKYNIDREQGKIVPVYARGRKGRAPLTRLGGPAVSLPEKKQRYALNRRQSGLQNRYGRFRKEENIFILPGVEPIFLRVDIPFCLYLACLNIYTLSDNRTSNDAANPLYFYMFRPVIGQQQAGVHNSEQLVIYKVTNMCVCVCVCVLLNRF